MDEQNLMIKERLLKGAEELFLKYGVRSVSMDDIARHLSVSKKTIYQYFADKDEIVTQMAQGYLEKDRVIFEGLRAGAKNALDELVKLSVCLKRNIQDVNASLLFDLKKYHTKAWGVWADYKNKYIRESVVRNLKQGMEEGLFRSNLNPEILAAMRIEMVQLPFDTGIFPSDRFSVAEVHMQMLDHFMYGLLTEKGRKLYEKYKQESNNVELIPQDR